VKRKFRVASNPKIFWTALKKCKGVEEKPRLVA
jgi:hypothetical protein